MRLGIIIKKNLVIFFSVLKFSAMPETKEIIYLFFALSRTIAKIQCNKSPLSAINIYVNSTLCRCHVGIVMNALLMSTDSEKMFQKKKCEQLICFTSDVSRREIRIKEVPEYAPAISVCC